MFRLLSIFMCWENCFCISAAEKERKQWKAGKGTRMPCNFWLHCTKSRGYEWCRLWYFSKVSENNNSAASCNSSIDSVVLCPRWHQNYNHMCTLVHVTLTTAAHWNKVKKKKKFIAYCSSSLLRHHSHCLVHDTLKDLQDTQIDKDRHISISHCS